MIHNDVFKNDEAEYNRIRDFLIRVYKHPNFDNCWDPGRLDWWRYNYHAEKEVEFFMKNAHYWMDGEKIVGLMISEYGRNDFFIIADPDYDPQLLTEIISWTEQNWEKTHKEIYTSIYDFDKRKINLFEEQGYHKSGQDETQYEYDLNNFDFKYTLKPGFRIMSFSEYGDYEQRVEVARNSFNNPRINETKVKSLQASPEYIAELELLTITPDNKAAGYCIGWLTAEDRTRGYIEPMGVHSDYRKMGFGKAMAKECFKRLKNLGVEKTTIGGVHGAVSNFLYQSLGPVAVKEVFYYKKTLKEEN